MGAGNINQRVNAETVEIHQVRAALRGARQSSILGMLACYRPRGVQQRVPWAVVGLQVGQDLPGRFLDTTPLYLFSGLHFIGVNQLPSSGILENK